MKKLILTLALIAGLAAQSTLAIACPNGYESCGERGQLCCPK